MMYAHDVMLICDILCKNSFLAMLKSIKKEGEHFYESDTKFKRE